MERKNGLVNAESPLNRWIDSISDYANGIGVEQVWFLEEARYIIGHSLTTLDQGFNEKEWQYLLDPKKPLRHHHEFYKLALHALKEKDHFFVKRFLKEAEDIARSYFSDKQDSELKAEHFVYRWAQDHLIHATEDLSQYNIQDINGDLDQLREGLSIQRYSTVSHSEADLDALLKGQITIGRHPEKVNSSGYSETWQPNVTFGFRRDDALSLVRFALDQNVDPEVLLRHSEVTRKMMECSWMGEFTSPKSGLFSEYDKRHIIGLADIDDSYQTGVEKLTDNFCYGFSNIGEVIDEVKSDFLKAQQLLNGMTDPRRSIPYFNATSVFFDLMMNKELVTIFDYPTSAKFHYERTSYKEK